MGTLFVDIPEDVHKKFRETLWNKNRLARGAVKEAITEALKLYIEKEEWRQSQPKGENTTNVEQTTA